jgi:hypothetical protein
MKNLVLVSKLRFVRSDLGGRGRALLLIGFVLALVLVGCGGTGSLPRTSHDPGPVPPPPPPPPAEGTVLVNLGEIFQVVPDNIVSFELTIDSVKLLSSKGDVSLLSNGRHFQLSTLKSQPLVLSTVAQGTYSAIEVGLSNPVISYIDSDGNLHQNVAASLTSSTIMNPSPFSVGSAPAVINLHPLLMVSLGDGSAISVNPGLNLSSSWASTTDLVGRFMNEGNSWVSIDFEDLPPSVDPSYYDGNFGFLTDSSTVFQGFNALGELTSGQTVEVDAAFRPDGNIRATRVKVLPAPVVAEGLTVSTSPAQLQMLVRESHGPFGVPRPVVGKALTVIATAATEFHLDPDRMDFDNLDFTPTFDANNIFPGQNVRAGTSDGSTPAVTAAQISLEKQSLEGTAGTVVVGSVNGQFSFPLTMAADSAFAKLTGHTSVLVTIQPTTEELLYFGLEDCVTCIAGGSVRVRGMIFFSGGEYRMVAERVAVM